MLLKFLSGTIFYDRIFCTTTFVVLYLIKNVQNNP